MTIPHKALVLVADGRKYLFLRNEGDLTHPALRVEAHAEQANPPSHVQSDAMDATDFHQLEENRFAAETAEVLSRRARAGDFERLIIAAPPKTLGELRKHYCKEVESRLLREVAKDLTDHPIASIEKILAE